MITRNFILHLTAGLASPLVINVNQYDQGEQWLFTLYNQDGTQYVPSSGAIVGIKSDNLGIINSGTVDSQGRVVINETQQMTAAVGKAVFELVIDDGTHGTANFVVLVEPKPGDNADLSESDISMIEEAVEAAANIKPYGSPLVASTVAGMTDHEKVYVYVGSETGYTSGNWYYWDGDSWESGGVYNSAAVQTDTTLALSGVAADAKKTGDEISDLKSQIAQGTGMTAEFKSALETLLEKVVYIDTNGQTYLDALHSAMYDTTWAVTNDLSNCGSSNMVGEVAKGSAYSAIVVADNGYTLTGATVSIEMGGIDITSVAYSNGNINIPAVTGTLVITISAVEIPLASISAVFTQGNYTVFSDDTLDSLKKMLVVTATYGDSSTAVIPSSEYTLTGTLTEGTSTITVEYHNETDTFDVTVTAYEIPEGYTVYDYIQKRNNNSVTLQKGNFIMLNDQTDLSVLSLEMKVSRKSGQTHAAGCLGVRNTSDWLNGYGAYFPMNTSPETMQISVRGAWTKFSYTMPTTPVIIEFDNPATSPISIKINGEKMGEIDWSDVSTPPVVPHGFWILGYGIHGTTSNTVMHPAAQIGYIKLRKADGECVGYYTPCVYNSLIGMYDQITKTFYTAATTSSTAISNGYYNVGNW